MGLRSQEIIADFQEDKLTKVLTVVSAVNHWTRNGGTLHPTGF